LGIVSIDVNQIENKLQRQVAAQAYIEALCSKKLMINVDESVLRSTDERKRGWAPVRCSVLSTQRLRLHQVNLIAAALSDGRAVVSVNKGTTNSMTVALFLVKLAK
jgi:hypothetical protein